jgi:DNA-directed RNA polymerase subunit M/transcription elongation factor TFIIS
MPVNDHKPILHKRVRCESCGSPDVRVTNTRGEPYGPSPVTRFYKCQKCGHNTKIIHP